MQMTDQDALATRSSQHKNAMRIKARSLMAKLGVRDTAENLNAIVATLDQVDEASRIDVARTFALRLRAQHNKAALQA